LKKSIVVSYEEWHSTLTSLLNESSDSEEENAEMNVVSEVAINDSSEELANGGVILKTMPLIWCVSLMVLSSHFHLI
jgi:hypothetical protein